MVTADVYQVDVSRWAQRQVYFALKMKYDAAVCVSYANKCSNTVDATYATQLGWCDRTWLWGGFLGQLKTSPPVLSSFMDP